MRHPCRTLLCDTLVGHSCRTLLWDTLVAYSCRTLLSDTLVGHPCRTLLWGTTTKVFNCKPSRFQNEFERDLLQKSHVKSAKGAFHTRLLPKQNKRFARDFLKNSHLKSAKRAFRTRQFQKSRVKSPKRAFRTKLPPQKSSGKPHGSTHIKQPCQAVLRFQLLQTTPAHTPIPMSPRHSRNFARPLASTPPKYCACHEM